MILPHSTGDLYHKYRPKQFKELVGNKAIVKSIQKSITCDPNKRPHAFLLTGGSGGGKTTTARIMALALNCTERGSSKEVNEPCLRCDSCKAISSGNCVDVLEINSADSTGIADIRQLFSGMLRSPMQVNNRVFILDECHQLSNAAQNSLLKELEEAPKHVYIILCSTHPQKIITTIQNRCQKFNFKPLPSSEILSILKDVVVLEGKDVNDDLLRLVATYSDGSPRKSLVNLQQVLQLDIIDKTSIVELLDGEETEDKNAIDLCFALDRGAPWKEICSKYIECSHVGPTALGIIIAGYFRNKVLKCDNIFKAKKYHLILDNFKDLVEDGKIGENKIVSLLFKSVESTGNHNAPQKF